MANESPKDVLLEEKTLIYLSSLKIFSSFTFFHPSSSIPIPQRCPTGEKSFHILVFIEDLFFIYFLPPIIFNVGHEFRLKHDDWMNTAKPDLHPGVSAQLHEKFEVSDAEIENSKSVRSEMCAAVNSLLKLGANAILAVSLAV
ncbi:hypothetical protein JHK87_001583 [Glycine soja]|nr:hypothetical protein JHK87_001583 [Glycine soja]